jgi:hypothetical protein
VIKLLTSLSFFALFASPAFAKVEASYLDLGLRQNRYLGTVTSNQAGQTYTQFATDLNLETQSEGFTYKVNPMAQGAFESNSELYFGIPEIYVQPRKIAPWFNLTIGRQKRTWSRLDEEFNLGIWQPQLRWDYLAPVQEGLVGVFFDWSLTSQVRFTFFTSPLAIPDQGPSYRLVDGKFISNNRWFEQPHSRLQYQGNNFSKDAPLYFKLDKPSEEDIVMHSSFGFGLQYQITPMIWSNFNYAYKPRNQIHLGIECTNCVDITNFEVTAVIHPKIVMHHVATWELGFDREDDRGWISVTGDRPNSSGFPEDYYQASLDSWVIAGGAYQHYFHRFIGKPSWMQYSYMRAFQVARGAGGGLMSAESVKSSLDRYPFLEVAAVDWRVELAQQRRNKVSLRTRYNYSVPERGGWLSLSLALAKGPVTWSLGADLLGANVDPDSQDAGLFSTYRANDRFFGGLGYVF